MTRAQHYAVQTSRPRAGAMKPLFDLIAAGLQPIRREVWLGLGFCPPKRCAIAIDPLALPGDQDCRAVAGLDVLLCYHGHRRGTECCATCARRYCRPDRGACW
jgi:hypothetical protein